MSYIEGISADSKGIKISESMSALTIEHCNNRMNRDKTNIISFLCTVAMMYSYKRFLVFIPPYIVYFLYDIQIPLYNSL